MKTLKLFSFACIVTLIAMAFSCGPTKTLSKSSTVSPYRVAIVYTSDNANSIAAAACAKVKYENNTTINVDNLTAATQLTAIQLIVAGDSVHKVLLMVDTSTVFATNKLTGANYDSLVARMYVDSAYGVAPDAAPVYYQATATKNLAEVAWASLYSTYTVPLIVEYLGDDIFAELTSRSKKVNTSVTAVDSTGSLTDHAYNGDWMQIYSGTGMGQTREITHSSTTTYTVATWTTIPDQTTLFRIKNDGEENELFYDMYATCYILAYLGNLSSNTVMTDWHKLIDKNYNINDGSVKHSPFQDTDYLLNTVIAGGKIIFDYAIYVQDN